MEKFGMYCAIMEENQFLMRNRWKLCGMERELYTQLKQWKTDTLRKPLILKGARQVGKTWLLKAFGKAEFENTAYLNCDDDRHIAEIFESNFDIHRIIRDISAVTGVHIQPGKSLIIIDEIQEVPRALQSLKYFYENAPEYHVCAAGSLLGITMHQSTSFPVGKVDILVLYPLSFKEFVRALEGDILAERLENGKLDEFTPLQEKLTDLLRQYYFTGGMPEVVMEYIKHNDLNKVRSIQNSILSGYSDDISKHTDSRMAVRIHQIWNSISQQLAKGNKRFIYGNIQKGARAKDFELALQWLSDAGIVYKIPRIRKAAVPLKFYEDFDAFKLFYLDCGLMGAITEAPAAQILIGNNIFEEYKGSFTEQYVLQQMMVYRANSIFYFDADDSKQEIDFMTQSDNQILAVEVKAEENLRAKSLRQFKTEHEDSIAVRLSMRNYREEEWMTNVPLFLAHRIFEIKR